MPGRSAEPWLHDILRAARLIRAELAPTILSEFAADIRMRWLIERAMEIISEASRRLPEEVKARHSHIPWRKIAAIGNILRHEYAQVSADILWQAAHRDLPDLEACCATELDHVGKPPVDT